MGKRKTRKVRLLLKKSNLKKRIVLQNALEKMESAPGPVSSTSLMKQRKVEKKKRKKPKIHKEEEIYEEEYIEKLREMVYDVKAGVSLETTIGGKEKFDQLFSDRPCNRRRFVPKASAGRLPPHVEQPRRAVEALELRRRSSCRFEP